MFIYFFILKYNQCKYGNTYNNANDNNNASPEDTFGGHKFYVYIHY